MKSNGGSSFDNLALEFVRVTEVAAIAAAKWIGKGEAKLADKAAVDAMRAQFNTIDFLGEIVIGEGAKDESHELYIGEKLGTGQAPVVDIAVDPLECTDSVANGLPNALTVIATGPKGSLYHAADSYMQKIAVGPEAVNVIDLDAPVADNIKNVAKALGTCLSRSSVDILMGTGGSSEAVLAAAAMRCLGGELLCRWKPKDEKHVKRLNDAGVTDFSTIFRASDLAKGDDISFTATGVVSGPLADGVLFAADHIVTHSVVMSTHPRSVRFIKTKHMQ